VPEDRPALEHHLDAALSAGDLDRALALARQLATDRRRAVGLNHALRLTALMVAMHHPHGAEATDRWRDRFRAERSPRRAEDEIAEAALRGLSDPEAAFFCERVLWEMIGADM